MPQRHLPGRADRKTRPSATRLRLISAKDQVACSPLSCCNRNGRESNPLLAEEIIDRPTNIPKIQDIAKWNAFSCPILRDYLRIAFYIGHDNANVK